MSLLSKVTKLECSMPDVAIIKYLEVMYCNLCEI